MAILVTGAAGFIGYSFCEKLLKKNLKTKVFILIILIIIIQLKLKS